MNPSVTAILYAPGTNCHEETAAAVERAGARAELVLLAELTSGRVSLEDFQAAIIPGGFSYGDHLGAGRIFASLLVAKLGGRLREFLEARKPLLGICNGFQVLVEAGILPSRSLGRRELALGDNQSAHFEDRKVRLLVSTARCVWTEGLAGSILAMPSAHGEGRLLLPERQSLAADRVALRFADSSGKPTDAYPDNPSSAPGGVAGVVDSTGLVLGLMPHPERASLTAHDSQDGLKIFENLAQWLDRKSFATVTSV
jgi:phosphoribosylformylglycinamidine synthase subunit PurQ / glutaminase